MGGRGGRGSCREVTCFPGMGVVYAEVQNEMCTDGQHQIAVHATWWADGAAGHARDQPVERTGRDVAGEGTARQGQGGWMDTRGAILGSEHPRQLWEERKRGWGGGMGGDAGVSNPSSDGGAICHVKNGEAMSLGRNTMD